MRCEQRSVCGASVFVVWTMEVEDGYAGFNHRDLGDRDFRYFVYDWSYILASKPRNLIAGKEKRVLVKKNYGPRDLVR